ncbi:MAG TPA: hypothetical protein VNL13_00710 [Sulfolobales archaeon]|nr:hypothetical protein [Sulfolobales archaeon]
MAVNRQRLRQYDLEGWVHVTFYKAAVLFSIIEALTILAYLTSPSPITSTAFRVSTIIYWFLLTPSFYELTKGFLMIYSRGAFMSHIAENVRERLLQRYGSRARLASVALYAAIILWIIAPIVFILGWLYG